jgi:hypothetical protein
MSETGLVTREDFVRAAQQLRQDGLSVTEIAVHFHVRRSTASSWLSDPDLSKQRARRKRYQGTCEDCGAATDGSNGRKKAPHVCVSCFRARLEAAAAPHPSLYWYKVKGCRCDECREVNRRQHFAWKEKARGSERTPHGTENGYANYSCRCEACRQAHADWEWLNPGPQKRWQESKIGLEPPRHGYSVAYRVYRCRCDECRAWNAATSRRTQRKKKAAA